VNHVRDTFRVILQMSLIMTFGGAMPVIKVGRMAGQFAKPRSADTETKTVDGKEVTLPSYRGDIINSEAFTPEARENNPQVGQRGGGEARRSASGRARLGARPLATTQTGGDCAAQTIRQLDRPTPCTPPNEPREAHNPPPRTCSRRTTSQRRR